MNCTGCDAILHPGWKACPECGAPVAQAATCQGCGAALKPKWKACPSCGAPVGQSGSGSKGIDNAEGVMQADGDIVGGSKHVGDVKTAGGATMGGSIQVNVGGAGASAEAEYERSVERVLQSGGSLEAARAGLDQDRARLGLSRRQARAIEEACRDDLEGRNARTRVTRPDPMSFHFLRVLEETTGISGKALAATPDGRFLVSADPVVIWDVASWSIRGTRGFKPRSGFLDLLLPTPNGRAVVGLEKHGPHGEDHVHLWDWPTGQPLHSAPVLPAGTSAYALAIDRDSRRIAVTFSRGDEAGIALVELDGEWHVRVLRASTKYVFTSVAFQGAECLWATGTEGLIRCDLRSDTATILDPGRFRRALDERPYEVVVSAPDDYGLIVGGSLGVIHYYPVRDQVRVLDDRDAMKVACSPDGRHLAIGTLEGEIRVLPIDGSRPARTIADGMRAESLVFVDGGRCLVASYTRLNEAGGAAVGLWGERG